MKAHIPTILRKQILLETGLKDNASNSEGGFQDPSVARTVLTPQSASPAKKFQ
jgi:hypothetical protein